MLTNLLENSARYTPAEGRITCRARVDRCGDCPERGRQRFRHRAGSPAPHLRAVLSRGPGPLPGAGRHRARSRHREASGGSPRRTGVAESELGLGTSVVYSWQRFSKSGSNRSDYSNAANPLAPITSLTAHGQQDHRHQAGLPGRDDRRAALGAPERPLQHHPAGGGWLRPSQHPDRYRAVLHGGEHALGALRAQAQPGLLRAPGLTSTRSDPLHQEYATGDGAVPRRRHVHLRRPPGRRPGDEERPAGPLDVSDLRGGG